MSVYFKKTIQLIFVSLVYFSINSFVFSQAVDSLKLDIFPARPRSNENVTLTLSSDLLDLNSSKIVWYVDGVARNSTTNKTITVTTNSSGRNTSVRVVVETSDGVIKEMSKEISPVGIDLVIEPIAYTMPFYKGKPYLIGEGSVRVTALPDIYVDGMKTPTKDLTFAWKRGENVLGSASGKGNNSIILTSSIPVKDINISVQVLDDSKNILGEISKLIILSDPKVLIYENNPLYGILYNTSILGSYFLGTREELKVVAKPFSFSFSKDMSNESKYSWYINNKLIEQSDIPNELILKQTSTNVKGTASLSVRLSHTNKINQFITGDFVVSFGE